MDDMEQDDIDALLNGIGAEEDSSSESDSGETDQSGIDALLEGGQDQELPTPPEGGEIDQSDIDALLEGGTQSDDTDLFSSDGQSSSTDDMESLLAEIQNDPSLDQSTDEVNVNDLLTELQTEVPVSNDIDLGQNGIDALMNSVSTDPVISKEVEQEEEGVNVDFLLDMKLTLTFEVGRHKMVISDLLSLGQGSVIELHRLVGEDLDLLVSGRLIAKGEVVVVNEKFGVRILDIIPPENRIKQMSGMDKI